MTSDNRTNSVFVRLPEKQYFKICKCYHNINIIATSILKKKTKECSKTILLKKAFIFLFQNFSHGINLQYDEETNPSEAIVIYSRSSDNQLDYLFLN